MWVYSSKRSAMTTTKELEDILTCKEKSAIVKRLGSDDDGTLKVSRRERTVWWKNRASRQEQLERKRGYQFTSNVLPKIPRDEREHLLDVTDIVNTNMPKEQSCHPDNIREMLVCKITTCKYAMMRQRGHVCDGSGFECYRVVEVSQDQYCSLCNTREIGDVYNFFKMLEHDPCIFRASLCYMTENVYDFVSRFLAFDK